MKTLILLVVMVGAGFAGWVIWRRSRRRKHDPVEYFSGWDGYGLPIRLTGLIAFVQSVQSVAHCKHPRIAVCLRGDLGGHLTSGYSRLRSI